MAAVFRKNDNELDDIYERLMHATTNIGPSPGETQFTDIDEATIDNIMTWGESGNGLMMGTEEYALYVIALILYDWKEGDIISNDFINSYHTHILPNIQLINSRFSGNQVQKMVDFLERVYFIAMDESAAANANNNSNNGNNGNTLPYNGNNNANNNGNTDSYISYNPEHTSAMNNAEAALEAEQEEPAQGGKRRGKKGKGKRKTKKVKKSKTKKVKKSKKSKRTKKSKKVLVK